VIFIVAPNKIVLASKSAARRSILANFGIDAEIYVTDADETLYEHIDFAPWEIVTGLSQRKARMAAEKMGDPHILVIAADTVVEFEGQIIGKPKNAGAAAETLSKLSGKFHRVYSGITVVFGDKTACDYDMTKVKFKDISRREIEQYVKTGDPLAKAGSYGAEGPGSAFIERIEGDFFNVAGLPVFKFAKILTDSFGMTVFDLLPGHYAQELPERIR